MRKMQHKYTCIYKFSCFCAQCNRMTAADNKRGLIYMTTLKRYIHVLVCAQALPYANFPRISAGNG